MQLYRVCIILRTFIAKSMKHEVAISTRKRRINELTCNKIGAYLTDCETDYAPTPDIDLPPNIERLNIKSYEQ